MLWQVILAILFTFTPIIAQPSRDVCILGSGASGMSAAVFLKDKGYDVLVLESADVIGGHCNTRFFTPPAPGLPNWIELGVQIFGNTTFANESGYGQWTLDSVAFVERFVSPRSIIPIDLTHSVNPNYGADFAHGISIGLIPPAPPTPEYIAAFNRLFGIVTEYGWLDTASYPDPIPPEILGPFSDYIVANNLQPLESSIFEILINVGGMGNVTDLTTVYALVGLHRLTLSLFTTPNVSFSIYEGCIQIYDGIRSYLGPQNVITNAKTIQMIRPPTGIDLPVKLLMNINNTFSFINCKDVMIAFPEFLPSIAFMHPTPDEVAVFQNVRVRDYFGSEVNVSGPISNLTTGFTLLNLDLFTADHFPILPAVTSVRRDYPYGPAAAFTTTNAPVTDASITAIIEEQLASIPPSLLTNTTLVELNRHVFQPYFTVDSLAQSPTPFTKIDQLQGQRHTYWLSALPAFAESVILWQRSQDIVNQYF